MSLFGLFDIGKSAIFASQAALNVVSNNIANVNTPGFSRREIILQLVSSAEVRGDYIGRGVRTGGIKRHYDKFIHLQLIGQSQNYGRSFALNKGLSQIEQIFNEAKDLGLSGPLEEYFNAWQEVATNPEGQPQRIVLLQKANALVQSAKQMERGITDTLKGINEEVDNIVERINSTASNIATLNAKISQIEAGLSAEKANDFRDERDRLLNGLAELVEFSSYEDSNGKVTVVIGKKNLVEGENVSRLSTTVSTEGDINASLEGEDITSLLDNGQIGGFFAVRDDIKLNSLYDLRKLIASITKEINLLHNSGYGLDGSTGNDFFDQLQIYTGDYSSGAYTTSANVTDPSLLTLDEYDISFVDASNYEVYNRQTGVLVTSGTYTAGSPINFEGIEVVIDGVPAANDSFFVSPLTDAIRNFNVAITDSLKVAAASSDTSLPGDNTLALQIVGLFQSDISDLNGVTFEGHYRGIVSNVGSMSRAASDSLTFDENLLSELQNRRESISGVSLDEEAANLIRFQRAFEAGARIIKVTDELLETIINL